MDVSSQRRSPVASYPFIRAIGPAGHVRRILDSHTSALTNTNGERTPGIQESATPRKQISVHQSFNAVRFTEPLLCQPMSAMGLPDL